MKIYLQNRKTSEVLCSKCGLIHLKPISEINRNLKLNRKMFCSRSCSIAMANINNQPNRRRYDITQHVNNRKDKYTPIRTYFKSASKRFKKFDLTLDDVLNQWENQKGICPYTGLEMQLRDSSRKNDAKLNQASLDRIDSSKGYTKDNIEFVCLGINYLKSNFTKEQVLNFLRSFKSSSFLEDRTISSLI